ncbi:hypothetical protein SLEP1_g54439 [Rubroshorea leprosula]|uniref:Reverse transcriptase domain-containing protein n=1 Tax=Rubroshorea leprosula TaxID=152421 RepID=A0AAV5MG21_9ROSI|nr:hypothetical protein SLEP1_g54439 [Rubroshorea leprosula]
MRERGRERVRGVHGGRRTRATGTALSWERVGSCRRGQQQKSEVERQGQGQANRYQGRVKQNEGPYDWGLYKQATPYFFTNFPEYWTYADMWRTFLQFGRVYDIYSPNRRSRNGSRFGFVRFLEVKDRRELEQQLDQIWVNDMKLWVNRPRYDDEKNKSKEKRISGEGSKQEQVHNQDEAMERNNSGGRVSQNQNRMHTVEMVRNLQEKFYMEGYFSCKTYAMGGRLVLLDCDEKEELKDLVEMASEWLGQWFEEVRPWTPETVAKERFVWVRCQGAPLNVWGVDFFQKMGSSWGKFICLDDSTSKKKRFDIARFLISTPISNSISVLRQIKINGIIYNIKFTEEEFTNSLFSLKQDFMPSFQSDSEEKESWSTESNMEEQKSEYAGEELQVEAEGFQEEDDDMLRNYGEKERMAQSQSRQEIQKSAEIVEDSLEQIQNLNVQGRNVEAETETKKHGKSASSMRPEDDNGPDLGFKKNDQACKKPMRHEESLECVESTNMGLAQDSLWVKKPKAKGIMEFCKENGTAEDNIEDEDADLIWEGYVSESESIQRGMSNQNEGSIKRKGRRVRNCSLVYLKSFEMDNEIRRSRGRGRGKHNGQPGLRRALPDFMPSPNGKVAGDSIGDSEIHQCNKSLKKQLQNRLAKEIWELAKQLGATTEDEEETIRRIEEMESRDRHGKVTTGNKGEARSKKTKLEIIDRSLCRRVWGSENLDWVSKPSNGLSGGLLCIWNSTVFKKKEVLEGDNFIGVFGVWGEEETPVFILNIYSPCQLTRKRALWEELYNLIKSKKGCWCLTGDYNSVRRVEERAGCKELSREMKEFDEFIRRIELIDLPLLGRKFTWYNSNGQQMSRLDRFLVSEDWISKWSDIKQWGLKRTVSDHCPILLKNEKVDWGPKPFKFFDSWLEQPGCREVIRNSWKSTEVKGWSGFILKEKLQRTKKALKEWSAKVGLEMDRKIKEVENMIAEIDEKGKNNQLSTDEIEMRKSSFLDLWKNLRIKERMSQQKSRKMWLKEGDANTRFFHNCIKGRWRRREINSVQIDGEQFTGVTKIKEEVAKYFQTLFTEERWKRPKLDGVSFKQVSQADNELLTRVFSEEEIKEAIWDCDSSKSPGPDGFNFRFIKEMCEDIKPEVIAFIREFHKHGRIVRGANASFIVLIPKTENPQRIEEYRPISLIGVMYKIIAKLLANRLQKVLPKEFMDYMMMRLGFNETWRKWIMECLRSVSVSVLINGSPTNQFSVSKGIRQGDPLSPFLFLIVGLNGLVASTMEKGIYKGVKVGNEGVMVSHLQFADDMVFFGEALEDNIRVVKTIMRIFKLASGLKINFEKSHLMGVGVAESWQTEMAYRLQCKEGELPFKYLGIPIGGNNRRKSMWQPMVQSVERKLDSWKGRYLSMGGRITLINSVLSSLPVFLMSTYLIPKGWLSEGFRMKIGEGKSVSFWWDNWGGEGCLANKFPRLYLLSTGKENTCNQMGNIRSGSWEWKLTWRRNLFGWEAKEVVELERMIEGIKITQGCLDKWEWIHDKEGHYSTKTAYHLLATDQSGPSGSTIFKRIWNPILPTKVSAFNWQLMLDRIPTKVNLLRRGIIKDLKESKCVICEEQEEDSAHLFLRCRMTQWLWEACAKWWGAEANIDIDCSKTFENFGEWSKETRTRQGWDCIWSAVVWTVWLARNQNLFQHKEVNARKMFELIQLRSFIWVKARNDRYAFTFSDWLLNPVECMKDRCGRRKVIIGRVGCKVMTS